MRTCQTWSRPTIFVVCLFQNLLLFAYLFLQCSSEQELLLVNVVFRHGDRAPDREIGESFPNDPNINNTFFPMGSGGMTNEGKSRAYLLGTILRMRYDKFLGSTYLSENVKARSTDSERTRMSLQLVLAGLYPPNNLQKWNPNLNWQPIPFTYEKKKRDWLLWPTTCPRYIEEYERVQNTPEIMTRVAELSGLMDRLTNLTGKKIKKIRDILILHNTLEAEFLMNLPIPDWGREYLANGELAKVGTFQVELRNYNKLLKRLNGGILLRKMTEDMVAAKNRLLEKGEKIVIYSGHDLNLGAQLLALGITKPHSPNYTSAVILELYRNNDNYFIQVLYYLGIPSKMEVKLIPGCTRMCPLEKFVELLKEVMPHDDELNCRS